MAEPEFPEYDLESYEHRGLLLVFNHENFEHSCLSKRSGTARDAARLEASFTARGFHVVVHQDLKYPEITEKLQEASQVSREKYGSVIVAVLTHGEKGGLVAAKDQFYACSELRDPFINNPAFQEKPKVFLYQACRGSTKDAHMLRNRTTFTDIANKYMNSGTTITENDVLLAFATLEGHMSWRHIEGGTFFIQKFCDILEKHDETEIIDLLTATNNMVINATIPCENSRNINIRTQTSTFKSTLLKNFVPRTENREKAITDENQPDNPEEGTKNGENLELLGHSYPNEFDFRGPAIIFHDSSHEMEALNLSETMNSFNFRCQTIHHVPSDRELTHIATNWQLEQCNCLFIAVLFADEMILAAQKLRIVDHFNTTSCPDLISKPKIVLLGSTELQVVAESKVVKTDNIPQIEPNIANTYSDFLFIYGHSKHFLEEFAKQLKKMNYNVTLAIRQAQSHQHSLDGCKEPLPHLQSTLRGRVDFSQEKKTLEADVASAAFEYNVREPVPYFYSRTKELNQISSILHGEAKNYKLNVLLSGIGGIGKTQTVLRYIQQEKTRYDNILWIDSSSVVSIERHIRKIALKLRIVSEKCKDIDTIIALFYENIGKLGKTLMVFDNLEKYTRDELDRFLPCRHDKTKLRSIATSIHTQLTPVLTPELHISVNTFTADESSQFLREQLKSEDITQEIINDLGESFSYHPLALAIAVGLIETKLETSELTPNEVVEDMIENQKFLLDSSISSTAYNKSLAYIVLSAIDHLKKTNNELAVQYLKMISCCEPDSIPCELLFQLENVKKTNIPEIKAIKKLSNMSLITTSKSLYFVHRIVQVVIVDLMEKNNEHRIFISRMLSNISKLQINEFVKHEEKKRHLLHAVKICNTSKNYLNLFIEYQNCIKVVSEDLQTVGWYRDSVEFSNKQYETAADCFGANADESCEFLIHKINALRLTENYKESLSIVEYLAHLRGTSTTYAKESQSDVFESLQVFENNDTVPDATISSSDETMIRINSKLGARLVSCSCKKNAIFLCPITDDNCVNDGVLDGIEIDPFLLKSKILKATVLYHMSKYEDAIDIINQILEPNITIHFFDFLDILQISAQTLKALEKFNEALKLLDLTIFYLEKYSDFENLYASIAFLEKAHTLFKLGQYEKALEIYHELQNKVFIHLGPTHPEVLSLRNAMAGTMLQKGEYESGLQILNDTLENVSDRMKKELKVVTIILHNKVKALCQLERVEEARSVLNHIMQNYNMATCDDHPAAFHDMFKIGVQFFDSGQYSDSVFVFEKLLDVQSNLKDDKNLLSVKKDFVQTLIHLDKYPEANKYVDELLEFTINLNGKNHPGTVSLMLDKAKILERLGKFKEALNINNEAIEIGTQLPELRTDVFFLLKHQKGDILHSMQKYFESLSVYNEILSIADEKKIDKQIIMAVKHSKCLVLSKLGKSNESMELCNEVLKFRRETFGVENPYTLASMNHIAYLLLCQKRYAGALINIDEVEQLRSKVLGEDHPHTLHTKYNKALILSGLAKYEDALIVFDEVLDKRRVTLGSEHPEVLYTMLHRAKIIANLEKYEDALKAFEELWHIQMRIFGTECTDTICTMSNIAGILEKTGEFSDALKFYVIIVQVLGKVIGPNHPTTLMEKANRDRLLALVQDE